MTDDRSEDLSYENEGKKDYSPMVQISLKEYDKLKERSKYITDRDLIGCIDKIEELVRALRKHIVRSDFK
jgi:superfamily I DNA and/or RNA helicase